LVVPLKPEAYFPSFLCSFPPIFILIFIFISHFSHLFLLPLTPSLLILSLIPLPDHHLSYIFFRICH
jgi:hypothetical protein